MTRAVSGTIALAEGQIASFVLCDRYERDLGEDPIGCTVGESGLFSATLEVTGTDKCYVVETDVGNVPVWVYEGDSVQELDLTAKNYPRNSIDVFLYAEPAEAVHNASRVVEGIVCGLPVINEEEQRFVCRYENYAAGEEDKEMCAIDTGIGGLDG